MFFLHFSYLVVLKNKKIYIFVCVRVYICTFFNAQDRNEYKYET